MLGSSLRVLSRRGASLRRYMGSDSTPEQIQHATKVLCSAQAVCFDVDSTVIAEEGIDVLAAHCGAGDAVAQWTTKAMSGSVLFQDALQARLDLIRPSKADIASCLEQNPLKLTNGVAEFIAELQKKDVDVYLVSGGFRLMIEPVAEVLGIPKSRIFANTILFDEEGKFSGFDATEPTSRDGGKPDVIRGLLRDHGYSSVVMIGDGATDLQARPPASLFIGFGGIAVRDAVKDGADWFVRDFSDLTAALKN